MKIILLDFITGRLLVSLTGGDAERFFSLCASSGIVLSSPTPGERAGDFLFRVSCRAFPSLRSPARRAGVRLRILKKEGLPFLLRPLKARPGLWGGGAFALLLLYSMTFFLWSTEVTGVSTETARRILSFLSREGLHTGAFLSKLDAEELKSRLLIGLDELDWAAVNIRGVKAVVQAVESPPKPEDHTLSPSSPADLVAGKEGVVLYTNILRGEQLVFPGAAVKKGEIIASHEVHGVVPGTKEFSGAVRYVHAAGEVIARREGHIAAVLPSARLSRAYTGREYTEKRLYFADFPIKFSKSYGNPYGNSDIIKRRSEVYLPGGRALPIALEKTRMTEYDPVPSPLPAERAAEELRCAIEAYLLSGAESGQIEALDCVLSEEEGFFRMDAEYIITEDIGEEILFSP